MPTCITVAGVKFDIGVPVLRWDSRNGFDGYDTTKYIHKTEDRKTGKDKIVIVKGKRYTPRNLEKGLKKFNLITIHHTGGYRARTCFDTLHKERGLSVPFINSDYGTIFQCLDAVEYAWHAGKANPHGPGIENVLYPWADLRPNAYSEARCKRLGLAPHEVIEQTIRGRDRKVFHMPDIQIDSMARLCAGLWAARATLRDLIAIAPAFPSDQFGEIPLRDIKKPLKHNGLLLHMHLTKRKTDAAGIRYGEFERVTGEYYREMIENGFLARR